MNARRTVVRGVELVLLGLLVALLVGQAIGQPAVLSYVETDSMAPTLDPGDGFVAVPAALTGPPSRGDVVVFRAQVLEGGGLTTHRVVGRTDGGFVTHGDANPFTDQAAGEPPVRESQVVAEALQVDGRVVVIPDLGTGIIALRSGLDAALQRLNAAFGIQMGSSALLYLVFLGSVVGYLFDAARERTARDRRRDTSRQAGYDSRTVVGALALVVVVAATASMLAPSGTTAFVIESAETPSDERLVVQAGTAETTSYTVSNPALYPNVVVFESAAAGVTPRDRHVTVPGQSTASVDVTLHAPPETGIHRLSLVERWYLPVLPPGVVVALHAVHPLLPVAAIDALLGGAFYALGMGVVGSGRLRLQSRSRELGQTTKARRFLRTLYRR